MKLFHLNKFQSWEESILCLFSFILGALAILTQYRWNPDPHHDGIMYTAAIAVQDGLLPNKDFFAQYGPMTPFIQGLSLNFFGDSLTGLRFFTAFLLIATGAMLGYRALQILGMKFAILVFLIWSLTGPMGLPWSSVISTFLLTFVLFMSFSIKNRELILRPRIFLITSQLLVLGILIRAHLIFVTVLVLVVLVTYRKYFPERLYLKWFVLTGLNLIVSMSFLYSTGVLQPYIEQSFVWAFKHYASPAITRTYLSGLIWFLVVPMTVIILIKTFTQLNHLSNKKRVLLLSTSFLAITSALVFVSHISRTNSDSLFDLKYFSFELLRRSLLATNYIPVMFAFIIFSLHIFKKLPRSIRLNENYYLVAAISIGTMTQLYPLFDPWHLWMVSPVFLVAAIFVSAKMKLPPKLDFGATSVLAVILAALTLNFVSNSISQTYHFESSVLRGMSSSREDAVFLDKTLIKMEKLANKESEIVFLCGDGLYASANKHFLSRSFMFVDWGFGSPKITQETDLVFLCEATQESVNTYLSNGWAKKFILPNGHLNIENQPLFNSLIVRQDNE